MKTTAIVLIVSLFTLGAGSAWAQESADWRKVADAIELGSKVRVQTTDGRRLTGTLMRVDSKEMLVKRNTRRPEPAITVAFDDVAKLERHKDGGFNVAKAIAIGVASGAGAMLTLILFAMQLD
jgi:small nuclear ribonucleoprotein (snRNP)-like protein